MNYHNVRYGIFFSALLFLLGTHTLCAQDEPQQPQSQEPEQPQDNPYDSTPKPAGQSLPYFDLGSLFGNPDNLQPDYTPLTGMLNAGLGFPEIKHSYWVPGIQFSSSLQSSQYNSSGNTSGWYATNYALGNLSLLEAWNRSQLALNYTGGGTFSTSSSQGSGAYQQLAFAQSFLLNRWIVQIVDDFSQLPQSAFGFGVGTNLGVPGVPGSLGTTIPAVGSNYVPNQSVFFGYGPRYSNAVVAQATYQLTRRSSITASGSYGILHFVDSGNIDTNSVFGSLGYNYTLTKKDTIGLFYQFSGYHFIGNPQAYGSQTVSAAYSRKITGRMALTLYGGPQFTSSRVPVGTTSTTLNFYASAFLTYAFEKGTISGSYLHGLTGGSGVLTGSISDQVTFTATRRLNRLWTASANLGFAQNRTVINSAGTASNPSYNDWFVSASVGRPIGRDFVFSLAYNPYFATNNPVCSVPGCGTSSSGVTQTVTLNFQWHPRPFVLP
jgi:hypothetical protein